MAWFTRLARGSSPPGAQPGQTLSVPEQDSPCDSQDESSGDNSEMAVRILRVETVALCRAIQGNGEDLWTVGVRRQVPRRLFLSQKHTKSTTYQPYIIPFCFRPPYGCSGYVHDTRGWQSMLPPEFVPSMSCPASGQSHNLIFFVFI